MSKKQQRIIYESAPTDEPAVYPAVIRIDPVLPCSSCGRPASAALATMAYRLDSSDEDIEVATGEWLIKPICGTCAEGITAQYSRQSEAAGGNP